MCRYRNLFIVLLYLCIVILCGRKVDAYEHFNDILNPNNEALDEWHQRSARVAIRTNEDLDCERPNFYICEEPPNVVPPDIRKICNYRNVRYHEQVYRWVAGRGCLLYTPDFLYNAGYNTFNLSVGCYYGNLFAPCMEIAKEDGVCGCFPFDPGFEEVATAVRQEIIPSAHGRWERCFYAASDCCSHYMLDDNTQEGQCGTTFDGWTCWHPAEADTIANEVCSEFAYSNVGPSCNHFSNKQCFQNGTWELQTDYSTCSIAPRLLRRYRFHIGMLAFSIISCMPAVVIFLSYKRLRNHITITLHRNLLIAIIVRCIVLIISRSEVYIEEVSSEGTDVLSNHSVACRILSVIEKIAGNAVFVCMLVEGIYLHRLIVAVFRKKLNVNMLYGIGAVIAIAPVAAWAVVMGIHNNHSCWVIYTVDHIQWILDAPRIAILLLNTILFVDVLRVLLTKIKNNTSENSNQLSTARTTLFLMPIFGTQFLLTAFRPNTTNCASEQVYYYISYAVEGMQGFIVAMLYCYVNKEVRGLLKLTYKKTETAVVSRVRRDSNYPRMSMNPKDRRMTYSTAVHSQNDANKDYTAAPPKLHVAEIISIQASERLADILEPVYETIEDGVINEGYDSLERSSVDNDSGFIPNRESKADNSYNFTNVSSVSIDCQDWIKGVSSPSSSIYNNSLNDYETRHLERKFPNHPKLKEYVESKRRTSTQNNIEETDTTAEESEKPNNTKESDVVINDNTVTEITESDYEDCDNNMLYEILQCIEINDDVTLDPDALSPNRKDGDKIVFVDI